jgi:hypothetical protein
MTVIRAILLAMIPTLMTGFILGLFTYRLNTPEKAIVEVEFQYVRVPNPFFYVDRFYPEIDAAYLKLGFAPPLSEMLKAIHFQHEV